MCIEYLFCLLCLYGSLYFALPQQRAAAAEEANTRDTDKANTRDTDKEDRKERKKRLSVYRNGIQRQSVYSADGGVGSMSIDELRLQIMKCTRVTAVGGNTSCLKSMCALPTTVRVLLCLSVAQWLAVCFID